MSAAAASPPTPPLHVPRTYFRYPTSSSAIPNVKDRAGPVKTAAVAATLAAPAATMKRDRDRLPLASMRMSEPDQGMRATLAPLKLPGFKPLGFAYTVNELGNWLGEIALA